MSSLDRHVGRSLRSRLVHTGGVAAICLTLVAGTQSSGGDRDAQLAYQNAPLYTFTFDKSPGDIDGTTAAARRSPGRRCDLRRPADGATC